MTYTPAADRYESMPYARSGKSGLKLPKVSLGFWHNFGDVDDQAQARAMMHRAFDLGITHFDFANNYGPPPGAAERNCGWILSQDFRSYRDELLISTKAGYLMWPGPYGEWGTRKYVLSSLDQSLQRLGMDYVDIFYSHRPDPQTPLEETMGALDSAVRAGKALYVGLSNYSPAQTREAASILKSLGTPCLIHQPKYSMLVRGPEQGLFDVLTEFGIGCIPFSPLAQGLLTDKYLHGIPESSRAGKDHGFLQKHEVEPVIPKIQALHALAQRRGQSLAEMALAWVMRQPAVTSVLIGASSVAQIEQNVACLKRVDFTPEELAEIDRITLAVSAS
jgi:L-glyceraldehyde 3-phosphate reductase